MGGLMAVPNSQKGSTFRSFQHRSNNFCNAFKSPIAPSAFHSSQEISNKTIERRSLLALAPLLTITTSLQSHAADASTERVFFDISADGKPLGRIIIEVDLQSPSSLSARRFLDLAEGKEGVAYRKTRFDLIQDNYIQNAGPRSLSYKASGRTKITGGPTAELLEDELEKQRLHHDAPGIVSLVVRSTNDREMKEKLVAVKGQFVTVTEVLGDIPNGSAFCITSKPEPLLDSTNVIVGKVVDGLDVVEALNALPRVKDNSSSPFFQYVVIDYSMNELYYVRS